MIVNTTPLPLGKIGLLGLILAVNNTSIWMIFSFLPFMVSDFYPELSVRELGYKAGILGSSYSAGAILGYKFTNSILVNFINSILYVS